MTPIPTPVAGRLSYRKRIAIALLVCLLSLLGASRSYSMLIAKEEQAVLLDGYLKTGPFNYHFLHRVGNELKCIGTYQGSFGLEENSYTYEGKGELRVLVAGTLLTPTFVSRLEFSELNQLGGSNFRLRAGPVFLSVGTVGVDPMEVRIRFTEGGPERTYSLKLPGPIELKKRGKDEFGLRYPQLQNAPQLNLLVGAGAQLKDAFVLQPSTGGCSQEEVLNLDPFITALQRLLTTITPPL